MAPLDRTSHHYQHLATRQSSPSADSTSQAGVAIAATVGTLVFICFLIVLFYLYRFLRRVKEAKEKQLQEKRKRRSKHVYIKSTKSTTSSSTSPSSCSSSPENRPITRGRSRTRATLPRRHTATLRGGAPVPFTHPSGQPYAMTEYDYTHTAETTNIGIRFPTRIPSPPRAAVQRPRRPSRNPNPPSSRSRPRSRSRSTYLRPSSPNPDRRRWAMCPQLQVPATAARPSIAITPTRPSIAIAPAVVVPDVSPRSSIEHNRAVVPAAVSPRVSIAHPNNNPPNLASALHLNDERNPHNHRNYSIDTTRAVVGVDDDRVPVPEGYFVGIPPVLGAGADGGGGGDGYHGRVEGNKALGTVYRAVGYQGGIVRPSYNSQGVLEELFVEDWERMGRS